MTAFTESIVEEAALAWLEGLGYAVLHGPDIAPGEPFAEREDYGQVVLERRLRQGLQRLNPDAPADALDEAFRRLTRPDSPSLVANNHAIHRYLVEGVPVEYQRADGSFRGDLIRVLDHEEPEDNDFLAINQFTVVEDRRERRPDVVLFVNGLPLAVIELKNAADENADVWKAFNQLQTYKQQIPSLFTYNEALLVSDGVLARLGTLTANREWFLPWRTITGEDLASPGLPELQVVLEGAFDRRRFLDLIRHFVVFEDVGGGVLVAARRRGEGEGFEISREGEAYAVTGGGKGLLYGVYRLLMKLAAELDPACSWTEPVHELRMLNHWDNMDGTVERGYAGSSLFFRDGAFINDWPRLRGYARMLASVGINAVCLLSLIPL